MQMKTLLAASLLAAQAAHASCALKAPAVLCVNAKQAASAFHQLGTSEAAFNDTNNRQLLKEAGCTVGVGDVSKVKLLEMERGRVATEWGWTELVLLDVDGRYALYTSPAYVAGKCDRYTQEASERNRWPARSTDPTRAHYGMPTTVMP